MAITTSQWSHVLTIPESYTPSAATSGQTLVITESVIAKLSAGDQTTFWSNVQNGGGDVRICTDSGGVNQLPVEVVSLDNSAQTCVIWTRKPSFDGTANLYLFIGKAGETQPPVTDPFGRNAVWVDYLAVLHLNDTNWTDSTGNGYDATGSATLTTADNPFGGGWAEFNTFNSLTIPTGSALNNSFLTVQAIAKIDSSPNDGNDRGIVSNRFSTQGNNFFQLTNQASRTTAILHDGAGENSVVGSSLGVANPRWMVMTTSASSVISYLDGAQDSIYTSIASDNQLLTSRDTRIGTYFDGSTNRTIDGKVGEVRIKLSTLSSDYVATEYANQSDPATFFGTPTLATTGGTVSYTITLDSGSYTLVGEQLNLLSDRTLSLQNGGYSLTGEELNLSAQRTIRLSDGVYTKQGTDTGFILDRFLSLDTGSYSYIGTDLNLQYGREFRLILEQGSYSLQGSEVGVLKDYILPMDSSNYTYTSDNVSLLANRRITTDAGDYSYTGSNVNFVYEALGLVYTLSLDSGDYNLTGDSLKILVNRILPIDFGHYVYEGVDSKLLYNRAIALDSGVYSSSGTDLGVKVNRRLVFQDGNYSLQGTPVTLSYTGEVLAILEGYNLTYKKHPVQSKYKTYNITARYN